MKNVSSRTPGPSAERSPALKGAGEVNPIFLRGVKAAGRFGCKTYLRVHCEGVENAPAEGAFLIVINHLSGLDSFLIGFMIERTVYCLAKVELYRGPVLTWILNSLGYIPLDRSTMDISAMRIVLQLLKNGEAVGIAPEGTRSPTGEMQPFTHGATKLALHAQVPLLPVSVYGTRELMPPKAHYFKPGKVYIKMGKLFDLSESYGKRMTPDLLEENTAIIYQKVAELFEEIRVRPLD
jgi:1-acyl-sn-glycerol-3-phosphate acyltransferase